MLYHVELYLPGPLITADKVVRQIEAENAADAVCMLFDILEAEGRNLHGVHHLSFVAKPDPHGAYITSQHQEEINHAWH